MKPSHTCHVIRKLQRSLSLTAGVVSDSGILQLPFPDIYRSTNFRNEYFMYNVSRKLGDGGVSGPQRDAAYAKFLVTEEACALRKSHANLPPLPTWQARVILRAQQIIEEILGDHDTADWSDLCEFTAGASTSRKREDASPVLKYDASIVPDVTPLAVPYLLSWVAGAPEAYSSFLMNKEWLWCTGVPVSPSRPFYRVVPGAKLNFVPKDWDIARVTLAEPDWNMFLQKGCGNYIRKRLKQRGLDLNSDKLNQMYAFAGSISGSLGTLDLSSASDSLSIGVCQLLLPLSWFETLYALRSPTYSFEGKWVTLQKMCSMGNGYTFELESMIFYAISQACIDVLEPSDRRIAVFGDDIIVASDICDGVRISLGNIGFSLNRTKSFWGDDPFRESCGKHYHYGSDCTPVFLKVSLDDPIYKQQFINQLCAWDSFPNGQLTDFIHWLADTLPEDYRNQIPVELGYQGGLHHAELCVDLVVLKSHVSRNREKPQYGCMLHYYEWTATVHDTTERYADWSFWLYVHMTGYSSPDGPRKITSSDGRRLKRVKRVVSTARGT